MNVNTTRENSQPVTEQYKAAWRVRGKKIIYGCASEGEEHTPYLTRYTFFSCKAFQVCLHVFHRSDHADHHDHPWNFTSIILWRGYYEETVKGLKRVYPGMILRRKAAHRHRVVLVDNKSAITLVIMGKYRKTWGFFTREGWVRWKEYFLRNRC